MRMLLVGLCCALAGCAGQAMETEPRIVRVEVAVPVPCTVPPMSAPAWATGSLKKTDDLQTKVRAMLAANAAASSGLPGVTVRCKASEFSYGAPSGFLPWETP